jgi:HEAT repeat protein
MDASSLTGDLPVARLIELLDAADENVRLFAGVRLVALEAHAEPAVPALTALLSSDSAIDRRMAAWALGTVGPGAMDAVPALRNALEDADATVRKFAAEAIHSIDPEIAHQHAA